MSGILINVDANADKAQRDLAQINESLKNIKGSTTRVTESLSGMVRGFASLAAAGGAVAYVSTIANEFTNLRNQIKLVTEESLEFTKLQTRLVELSVRNRTEIGATTKIYTTLSKNIANAAGSSEILLQATESIQKAVALSGSSAESSTAAIIQLGQGLAAGALRGDELNSVMEQTPRLAKAIADGLGVTIGQMRALAAEGKITSNEVFSAILTQTGKLNAEFDKMQATPSQSILAFHTGIKAVVGEFETGLGLSTAISSALNSAAAELAGATLEARAFGATLGYSIESSVHKVKQIAAPIGDTLASVLKQTFSALPEAKFTRTFVGDFKEGLRQIDDASGGTFTRMSRLLQFGIYDLLTYDSAAEAALKRVKRLTPNNWLTGGWDTQTLNRFFSTQTLYEYADAFEHLAHAIRENSDSIFVKFGEGFRDFRYQLRGIARYVGLLPDTLLAFNIGDVDAFNYSITELLRGITGVQLRFTEVSKLAREIFHPSSMRLQIALEDIAAAIPRGIGNAIVAMFEAIVRVLPKLKQIIVDFFDHGDIIKIPDIKIPDITLPKFLKSNPLVDMVRSAMGSFDGFKDSVAGVFDSMGERASDAFDQMSEAISESLDKLSSTFKKLRAAVRETFDMESWSDKASRAAYAVFDAYFAITYPFTLLLMLATRWIDLTNSAFRPTPLERFRSMLSDVAEEAGDLTSALADTVREWASLAAKAVKGIDWSGIWDSAVTATVALAGQIKDTFNTVITSRFVRGLLEIGHVLLELASNFAITTKAWFTFYSALARDGNWEGIWNAEELFSRNMVTQLAKGIRRAASEVGEILRDMTPDIDVDNIVDAMESRIGHFTDFLKDVYERVAKFGKGIIRVFFEIWDEVVGHSWWPDTIDGVVQYSENLTSRVEPAFERFQKYVNGIFADLVEATPTFDVKEFVLDMKVRFTNIKNAVSLLVAEINNEFPALLRGLAMGVGALLGYLLLPMNAVIGFIITEMALSAASNLSFFAETISEKVFNASLAENLGAQLGELIAGYLSAVIHALPQVINFALTAAYGFGKAFLKGIAEIIPFGIGTLVSGILDGLFRILDLTGLGGPLGVVGLFLFGRSSAGFFRSIGVFTGLIDFIENAVGRFNGLFVGPQQGVIGRFLFGVGKQPIIAGLGLILTMTGAMDSLFNGSLLAKYGAMGLMGYALFGGNPVRLLASAWTGVIAPIFGMLQRQAATSSTIVGRLLASIVTSRKMGLALLAAFLFMQSTSANAAELSNDAMRDSSSVLDKMTNTIIELKNAVMDYAMNNPIEAMYAGIVAALGVSFIARVMRPMMTVKRAAVAVARDIVVLTRLDKAFALGGATIDALLGLFPSLRTGIAAATGAIQAQWAAMLAFIVPRWTAAVSFMKYQWWLFVNASFAAPFFDQLKVMLAGFGVWVAAIQARFSAWMNVMQMRLAAMSMRAKVFGAGLAVGAVTAAGSVASGADWDSTMANVFVAVSLFQLAGKRIQLMIVSWIARFAGFVGTVLAGFGAIAAAAAAIGAGILSVMFFGEGDTFMEKLDDVVHRLLRISGLSNEIRKNSEENKKRADRITAEDRQLIDRYKLDAAPDVSGINFDLINDREKSAIDSAIDKYKKALDDANTEYLSDGRVSIEMRDSVNKMGANVQALADRLAVQSARNLRESFKLLESDAQTQDTGWWTKFTTGVEQIGLDIGYAFTKGGLEVIRRIVPTDRKGGYTARIEDMEKKKDTEWKAGWAGLAEPDKQLQDLLLSLKRPTNIGNAALGKSFNNTFQTYREQLFETRDITSAKSGYTKRQKDGARLALELARLEMLASAKQVKAYEEREDAVTAFNKRLKGTSDILSEINVDVDKSQLFASTEVEFEGLKETIAGLKELDLMINKRDTAAEGVASFEERIAASRRKMELTTQLLLDVQHQYDKNMSTPQAALVRLNEATNMGFSKEAMNRITSDTAKSLVDGMQGLESLKTQLEKDTSIADIVFPPGTDAEVIERIRGSKSKAELINFIDGIERELRKKLAGAVTAGDYLKYISDLSGVGYTGQEVVIDTPETSKVRLRAMEDLTKLGGEMKKLEDAFALKPNHSEEDVLALMAAQQAYAQAQQRWNEQIEASKPISDAYNTRLERMSQLAGLSAAEILKIPKSITAMGATADGINFNFVKLDAKKALYSIDTQIEALQKKLNSNLLSSKPAEDARKKLEELKQLATAIGDAARTSLNTLPDVLARISAAGFSIQPSEWFAIDDSTFARLKALGQEVENITRQMSSKTLTIGGYKQLSKQLAERQAEANRLNAALKSAQALVSFDMGGFADQLTAANSATGVQFDRTTYAANKDAIDELTRQALGVSAWFEGLPKEAQAGMVGYMESVTDAIRVAAEQLAMKSPNPDKRLTAQLTGIGVSISAGEINRLTQAQRDEFSKAASEINLNRVTANDPSKTIGERVAAQKIVDKATYDLSEQIKVAVARYEDTPIYQASNTFATSITDAAVNGFKEVLQGKKDPKEFFQDMLTTFTDSVITAFIEGLTSPLTGRDGLVATTMRQLGASLFDLGGNITKDVGGLFGSDKSSEAMSPITSAIGSQTVQQQGFFATLGQSVLGGLRDTGGWIVSALQALGTMMSSGKVGETLSGVGGWLKDAWGAVSTFFGGAGTVTAATGGFISGPGTATSDSIPAMLSNGEYVINAAATKRFGPLLEAINSGRVGHFADGGSVSGASFGGLSAGTAVSATSIANGFSSLSGSVDAVGSAVSGMSETADAMAGATNTFAQINAKTIGQGFKEVGEGLNMMGSNVGRGFAAVGVQMTQMMPSGKFNWFGALLSAASMALSVYSFGTSMASASTATTAPTSAINTATPQLTMFAATGGYISGPGTGISDSIPAMLSNGEYVINAASTRKFGPLLEAINSGRIDRFATGGLVSSTAVPLPMPMPFETQERPAAQGGGDTIIQLTVTGDISRQTRAEIQRMIPNIASGVNSYNREKGNR